MHLKFKSAQKWAGTGEGETIRRTIISRIKEHCSVPQGCWEQRSCLKAQLPCQGVCLGLSHHQHVSHFCPKLLKISTESRPSLETMKNNLDPFPELRGASALNTAGSQSIHHSQLLPTFIPCCFCSTDESRSNLKAKLFPCAAAQSSPF